MSKTTMRASFIFYSSYYEAISELPPEEQGLIYKAIIDYGIAQVEPTNLTPAGKMCFKLIKPTIDAALSRYDASVENGKKGGRPRNNPQETQQEPSKNLEETHTKPTNNLGQSQIEPSKNLNKDMDIDVDLDIDLDIDKDKNFNNFNKESKKELYKSVRANDEQIQPISKTKKLESYEQIMDDFAVDDQGLRDALFEFIRHCQLNGKMVTNDKLKNLILRLDFAYPHAMPNEHGLELPADCWKIKAIKKAINSGYFDIPDLRDGI